MHYISEERFSLIEGGMMMKEFENNNDFLGFDLSSKSLRKASAVLVTSIMLAVAFQAIIPFATAAPDKVISIGYTQDIDTANPYVGVQDSSYVYYGMIYDYLIEPDANLEPQPNLAASWWYMDGPTAASLPEPTDFSAFSHNTTPEDWPLGSIWEYNLTENVFWNDGETFTADDVEFTINVQIGSSFATFWAYQPYTRWIDHAEAISDLKVRIYFSDLDKKYPFAAAFGYNLDIPMLPEHIFSDKEPTYIAFNWNGVPAIGTGPFMGTNKLNDELIAKDRITLVPNPYYNFVDEDGIQKGLGAAYDRTIEMDKLQFKFFSDENTLQLSVFTGETDVAEISADTYLNWRKPGADVPDTLNLISMLGCTAFSKVTSINAYPESTGEINPLRIDPAVQRAMAITVNKTYIKDQVFKGLAIEGTNIVATPVWDEWYWEPGDELSTFYVNDSLGNNIMNYTKPLKDVMEFDLELANQILDAAGYVWTGETENSVRKAGPIVGARLEAQLGIPASSVVDRTLNFQILSEIGDLEDKLIGNVLIQNWKDIGVYTELEFVDIATWSKNVYGYTYEVVMTYWSGDIDPNYLCFIPTSYALLGWNEFGTDRDDYDYLYLQQARSFNYTERKYWVDECSKWQYLSGSIITTVYPFVCFAYNNRTWSNWGNWTEQPGLSMAHFWGEAPLWQQLIYDPQEGDGDNFWIMAALGIAIAAIAAVAGVILLRKRKMEKEMMREADIEEAEFDSEKGEGA